MDLSSPARSPSASSSTPSFWIARRSTNSTLTLSCWRYYAAPSSALARSPSAPSPQLQLWLQVHFQLPGDVSLPRRDPSAGSYNSRASPRRVGTPPSALVVTCPPLHVALQPSDSASLRKVRAPPVTGAAHDTSWSMTTTATSRWRRQLGLTLTAPTPAAGLGIELASAETGTTRPTARRTRTNVLAKPSYLWLSLLFALCVTSVLEDSVCLGQIVCRAYRLLHEPNFVSIVRCCFNKPREPCRAQKGQGWMHA